MSKDQKSFVQDQIRLLEGDLAKSEANAEYIKDLMTDPSTAMFIAQSGVTLNDTPQEVNAKMAEQAYKESRIDLINSEERRGNTYITDAQAALKPQNEIITQTDARGNEMKFWSEAEVPVDDKPLDIIDLKRFKELFGWTPPLGFTETELTQFMNDNPTLSPEELESEAKRFVSGEEQPVATESVDDFKDITQRIQTAKDGGFSDDEIKEAIKSAYTEEELFAISKEMGFAKFFTGKTKDIDRFLNSLL